MSDAVSVSSRDQARHATWPRARASALRLSAATRLVWVSLLVAALWGGVYWALR